MNAVSDASRHSLRGAFAGLAAAALFGLSAPLATLLLAEVRPLLLAGLLYLGAGIALSVVRMLRGSTAEAALRRSDVPALAGVVILGGVVGPVLLLVGLTRVGALTGSLLLNLEAPLTIAVAVLAFREHLGPWVAGAAALIVAGALILGFGPGDSRADTLGSLAIAAACLAWALDNNLTQRLSIRDPMALVQIKTLGAGALNVTMAFALGHALPGWRVIAAALALGSLSYGLSVLLDAHALRAVGAAREAAYFATAPFVGALAAPFITHATLGLAEAVAMALMAAGVVVLLREKHSHTHTHDSVTHDHAHVHEEHHRHTHAPDDPSGEPHAHVHEHERLVHVHAHVSDAHHRHRH